MWTAVWDKILTGDTVRSRGMDFVDWCIMCHCNGETLDHLGLHGFCQDQLRRLSLVGGIGLESICLEFGI